MIRDSVFVQTPHFYPQMLRLAASAYSHVRKSVALLLVSAFLTSSSVWKPVQAAAAGDLDPSFDTDGKVSTDFFGDADAALDMVIQPDGQIVVAGSARNTDSNADFALARYNRDGSLDASFGSGGKVTTDFLNIFDQANALVLQPDGKIVAAGITRDQMDRVDFAMARYNSDGSLDASFGSAGRVVSDFGGGVDAARGIAIQPDGRIVAAGASLVGMNGDFALVRYSADGSLDASFGVGGKVTTDFFGLSDGASAVRLLPDGRIIAAGSASTSTPNTNFALARYDSDGSLDPTFGAGGKVITDFFGFSDNATALVVQPDGRVVAAGGANNVSSTGFDFALVRYNVKRRRRNRVGSLNQFAVTLNRNRCVLTWHEREMCIGTKSEEGKVFTEVSSFNKRCLKEVVRVHRYSYLRASIGSTLVALLAGTKQASNDTAASRSATTA